MFDSNYCNSRNNKDGKMVLDNQNTRLTKIAGDCCTYIKLQSVKLLISDIFSK